MTEQVNKVCVKASAYITLDRFNDEFKKNIGKTKDGLINEDQKDDIRYIVSEVLPQSGSFNLEFGQGDFFFEMDDMEVEEVN